MKTPREILLAQHQATTPKLDAIRHAAVAAVYGRRTVSSQAFTTFLQAIWTELIWPSRRIWAGLATVWVLIFVANFSMRDHSQPQMAQASSSPQMILAFRQQEQLLTELIGPNDPPVAEPAKPSQPRPTSLRQVEIVIV
jgi:hypothetical protein